jgi:hypothetical protein
VHLRRYLIELLRLIFSIDNDDLPTTLNFLHEYNSGNSARFIFSAVKKNELLRFCTLAKYLKKKCAANEWLTTAERDRDTVYDAVIAP